LKYCSKKEKNQINLRKIFIILLLIITLIILGEGIDLFLYRNKIFPKISASGVLLGGLNKEEA